MEGCGSRDLRVTESESELLNPHPGAAASPVLPGRGRGREERRAGWGASREGLLSGVSTEAVQGSQLPWSVLSKERLLVFRGDTGLGGLLRLELLEAVECLGESESSPSQSLAGASLPWSMPPEDSEPSDGEGTGCHFAL